MNKRYVVQRDYAPTGLKAGEVVYQFTGCTYGCVSDDEHASGLEHTAVTRDQGGGYPFLTVPVNYLNAVQEVPNG